MPAYLASSTEGAPPAPPALIKAVEKGDEKKVNKVLTKITTGGSSKKGKGRKKGGSKGNKGGTPTDFNACAVEWTTSNGSKEKAPLLADAALRGHIGVLELYTDTVERCAFPPSRRHTSPSAPRLRVRPRLGAPPQPGLCHDGAPGWLLRRAPRPPRRCQVCRAPRAPVARLSALPLRIPRR